VLVRGVIRIVRATQRAFAAADWAALRTLYHDDALLQTIAGGNVFRGPDETIAAMRAASAATAYHATWERVEALDDAAAVIVGRVRYAVDDRTVADDPRVWLYTVRGDRVFRIGTYGSASAARAAYRDLGASLGVGRDDAG
jgi:limonene-1,2-epoxide hydrolase